jgi:Flp pilus assembly protein TadG
MNVRESKSLSNTRGQSLVETAIMLPLLILLVLNVVNFAYIFMVIVNLTGAARSAALYSIEGSYTPYALQEAPSGTGSGSSLLTTPGTVAYTAYQDLTGAVWNPTASTTKIQVCSQINTNSTTGSGLNTQGGQQVANCLVCDSTNGCTPSNSFSGSPAPSADPEQPNFVLNEVDIQYQFNALFPGKIFNVALEAMPSAMCNAGTCTFTRRARMRSMGP